MSKLLFLRQNSYSQGEINIAVKKIFDHFGGIGRFVRPGGTVLLKVNLVAGHVPERRVTTDPAIVRSVAVQVLEAGGRPVIADSPGIESFSSAAEKAGFSAVARELGIQCIELIDPVPIPHCSENSKVSFHRIEAARLALEADAVINLPKLKTHGQMLLTMGVKNMFGCVVGQRKAEWHYNVGLSRDLFASLLLDIYNGIKPCLTIMDGVIGMDGAGPTSGNPYGYGLIVGAEDALSMDFWLCRMLGVPLENFPLWRAAKKQNMPQCELKPEDLAGDLGPEHSFKDVDIPSLRSLRMLPRLPFSSFFEKLMASRPVHVPTLCIGCGRCEAVCAAGALKHKNRKLTFDYSKCIRCYCCHEMCPVKAVDFKDSFLVRLMGVVKGIFG